MTASFVAGDTGSILQTTCKNEDGSIIDLTGATVRVKWKAVDGVLQSRTMTVVGAPAGGVVNYQFAAGELYAARMRFEIEITDSGGRVLRSLQLLEEEVRRPLAA